MNNEQREIKREFHPGDALRAAIDEANAIADGLHVGTGGINLTWGGYDYLIEACTINTPEKVLGWVVHLADKAWMDATKLRAFAQAAAPFCGKEGWSL